ncbi:MAG TPA: hypothetical protein VFM46_04180 [Pseudomonadales bacterium]|nr:hypothetical protein [Pseudomonadales bacterium]
MFKQAVLAVFFSSFAVTAMAWADTPEFSYQADVPPMPRPAEPPRWRVIAQVGYMSGGDELINAHVYNSFFDSTSSVDIKAGQGVWFIAGAEVPLSPSWAVQARVGYLFDSINSRNNSASFLRYPVEILPLFTINQVQFGVGLTYHIDPFLDSGWEGGDVRFKNALGLVAEINYVWLERARVGLHFTQIDYDVKSVEAGYQVSKNRVNGSGAGIHFTAAF